MDDVGSRLFDETLIARRRLRGWIAGVVAALVVVRVVAEITPVMRRPDLALLDFWQALRGTDRPSPQVVIVAIDEKSIGRFGPTPWPRSEYVPVIQQLAEAGARVIGFDFTFAVLEREAVNSQLLAEAMKKAGNVVFGYEFTGMGDPTPPGTPPSDPIRGSGLARVQLAAIPPAPGLIEPDPELAAAATALGHVSTVAAEDGRIRVLPLFVQHGDKVYPSLGLQLARVYTGTRADEIEVSEGSVTVGAVDIPVSGAGEVLLSWPAAGESAFARFSFLDVVRGDVPAKAFRGNVVLVAGTAPGLDDREFPFATKAPGVLTYATFLDNVFRVDFVRAPLWAWLLEWGLFLAACLLAVWLLPRLSTPLLLIGVPVLALLLFGVAGFLFVQKGTWVKVVYPGLALVLPLGLLTALRLTASEKATRDVVAEKLENQKLLGLSFQEKGMLDMALATFNKLPLTEDMKLVYVNLGLDYENRGLREKAYLVYKKVADVDPTFEDVARRMERVSQERTSVFATPTVRVGGTGAAAQATAGSPLADLVATPVPSGEVPTVVQAVTQEVPPQSGVNIEEDFETRAGGPAPAPTSRQPPAQVATGGAAPTARPPAAPTLRPAAASTPPPATTPTPLPGGPIGPGSRFGRYQIERHLGRGGMGDVYVVRDAIINRRAALKTIRPDKDLSTQQVIEMRQRFFREAQTAGQLTHPNIVTVYDVGEELGMSYIVMEFVEGETLTDWMKKQRLSVPQIKHIVYHAAMGLEYAHANGVFHRDVKPDNIMISKTGHVKVMDFGIARIVESSLTKTGSVIGTPAYMSPEQVGGEKVDGRSDVFSLGVILYELLTGKKPFTGETIPSLMFAIIRSDPTQPSALDASVHKAWDEILKKALAKNRDERYATAGEFAQAVMEASVR
jgi:CHASE2 domain-containing sensor protein/tRNA A-37 threonylcarbamoyl transferase component Bud32